MFSHLPDLQADARVQSWGSGPKGRSARVVQNSSVLNILFYDCDMIIGNEADRPRYSQVATKGALYAHTIDCSKRGVPGFPMFDDEQHVAASPFIWLQLVYVVYGNI